MSLRDSIPEKIHEIFERSYLADSQKELKDISSAIEAVLEEVKNINSLLNSRRPDQRMVKEIARKKEKVYSLIRDLWNNPSGVQFDLHHPVYISDVNSYIDRLPKIYIEEQAEGRFKCLETDRWQIKLRKKVKIFLFQTSLLPKKTWNLLLRLFRKRQTRVRFWNHRIPLKNSVRMAYQAELINKLIALEGMKYRELLETIMALKSVENHSDLVLTYSNNKMSFNTTLEPGYDEQFEQISKQLTVTSKDYRKSIKNSLSEADRKFADIMDKAGTIEMSARRLWKKRINREINRNNRHWLTNSQNWSRTLYALFDDWRLDLEINQLKYFSYQMLFQTKRKLSQEKKEYLSSLVGLSGMIEDINKKVKTTDGVTRNDLYTLKNYIRNNLDGRVIPEVIGCYEIKKLTGILENLIERIQNEINSISETRALVKADLYLRPLKEKEVNHIKPNELISFEVFPHFLQQIEQLKKNIERQHNEIVRLLPDLDNIIIFSIDTAVNATTLEEEQISPENTKIILNGILRAQNRISDFQQMTNRLFDDFELQLFETISRFTKDAVSLMQNENALDIRIKLIKAKTLHRTKEYRARFRNRIYRHIIRYRNIYGDRSAVISKRLDLLRKRYFLHATDAIITREISDFLRDSADSINGLPVIYRHLYQVEPVIDMDLFVGRTNELSAIKENYLKWRDGRQVSMAIVGEKWGGLSSFVNFFMINMNTEHPVMRISPARKYYQPKSMLKLLAVSLSFRGSADQQEIIKRIKSSQAGKVVIIEDLQHFFIRSFGGFESLRSLIEIIRNTNREVFWVCTCTRYAWNYLVKSFQINELFQDVIEIGNMTNDEIGSVIQKRNLIGGFRIIYLVPAEFRENKKFTQLDDEEQQKILEKRFFKRMGDFAQSNISMALIYWLLSTKEVTDDKILIGDFENPDHSYLYAMSQVRTYILLSLILHDGLNLDELTRVNNQTADEVQLHLTCLQEDGIIEERDDLYMVNPIIYRPIVNMLRSKNLIH